MIVKTEMSRTEFEMELRGHVKCLTARKIYNMIAHYPESKKNIVLDTLKANPEKYVKFYLQDDI